MKVVQMRHQCQILAGSGVEALRSAYGTAIEDTWSDEPSSSRREGDHNWDEEI